MKWLRRRVIASISTQAAETFAVVSVLVFVVLRWLANQGPWTALFGAVVIAQLVAAVRIGHAMRKNPLNYKRMRRYVEQPFTYRVSRFQADDAIDPAAAHLPGFEPIATIRDTETKGAPEFGIYHDPSRLVAASINRSTGSISLASSLIDGRILATVARPMPPHERIVMNVSDHDTIDSVIKTHRRALSARADIVDLASSAHQVVLDLLAMEFASYQGVGPALSPFLDFESGNTSWFRLTARIKRAELNKLPEYSVSGSGDQFYTRASENEQLARRLRDGILSMPVDDESPSTETPADDAVVAAPLPDAAEIDQVTVPQVTVPQVDIASAQVTPAEVAEIEVAPVAAPPVVSSDIIVPAIDATPVVDVPAGPPTLDALDMYATGADVAPEPVIAAPVAPALVAPEPVVAAEPVVTPASVVAETVAPAAAAAPVVAEAPSVVVPPETPVAKPFIEPAAESAVTGGHVADAPLDLTAAIASLSAVSAIDTPATPDTPATTSEVEPPAMPEAAVPAPESVIAPDPVVPELVVPESVVPESVATAPTAVEPEPVSAEPASPVAATPVAPEPVIPVPVASEPAASAPVPPAPAAPVATEPAAAAAPTPAAPTPAPPVATPAPVPPTPAPPALPTSLAEAVKAAPDSAAGLVDDVYAPPAAPTASYPTDVDPVLVPNLGAALGLNDELSPTRPRLSAVIRANSAQARTSPVGSKRSRRKSR